MPVSTCITCYRRAIQDLYPSSDLNQDVDVVSAFYVASLGDLVGETYCSPSLSSLAIAWVCYPGASLDVVRSGVAKTSLHSADEFREPAKVLFNAGLARFIDQDVAGLAESWQHKRECFLSLRLARADEDTSSMPATRRREAIISFGGGYVHLRLYSCGEI